MSNPSTATEMAHAYCHGDFHQGWMSGSTSKTPSLHNPCFSCHMMGTSVWASGWHLLELLLMAQWACLDGTLTCHATSQVGLDSTA